MAKRDTDLLARQQYFALAHALVVIERRYKVRLIDVAVEPGDWPRLVDQVHRNTQKRADQYGEAVADAVRKALTVNDFSGLTTEESREFRELEIIYREYVQDQQPMTPEQRERFRELDAKWSDGLMQWIRRES